jgi:hypothetical protein
MTRRSARPHRHRVPRIPKARRIDVRREELDRLVEPLNQRGDVINQLLREQQIQFQRIAQMQAELDLLKQAFAKLSLISP